MIDQYLQPLVLLSLHSVQLQRFPSRPDEVVSINFNDLLNSTSFPKNAADNNDLPFSPLHHNGKNSFCQGDSSNDIDVKQSLINLQGGADRPGPLRLPTIIHQYVNLVTSCVKLSDAFTDIFDGPLQQQKCCHNDLGTNDIIMQ